MKDRVSRRLTPALGRGPALGSTIGRALVLAAALLASTLSVAAQRRPDSAPDQVTETVQHSFSNFVESSARIVPAVAAAAIVMAVFWVAALLVRRVVRIAARYVRHPTIKHLLMQASYYSVWILGLIVALDTLGVDPQTVVTGLGLTGVALGLGLRDVLTNLVSGVVILATRSFEIGDQIVVGDTEGTVERIDLRATYIRTYDGRLVLVPNGEVSNSRVTNNTASDLRRASVSIYLGYRQDLALVLSNVLEIVRNVPGVASSPAPTIRLHDLTPLHMHIEARFWTDSRRADFVNTASTARIAIVSGLRERGIELPTPPAEPARV